MFQITDQGLKIYPVSVCHLRQSLKKGIAADALSGRGIVAFKHGLCLAVSADHVENAHSGAPQMRAVGVPAWALAPTKIHGLLPALEVMHE